MPFRQDHTPDPQVSVETIPMTFKDYLDLVDWTGRILRADKRGAIPAHYPPILDRLAFSTKHWIKNMTSGTTWKQKALGSQDRIQSYCRAIGQRW